MSIYFNCELLELKNALHLWFFTDWHSQRTPLCRVCLPWTDCIYILSWSRYFDGIRRFIAVFTEVRRQITSSPQLSLPLRLSDQLRFKHFSLLRALRSLRLAKCRFLISFVLTLKGVGARGRVVGWGTMLQSGRSQVRFPMSLDFSIDLIPPAALWAWIRLSL
jgi:hypothetical protein